MVEMCYNPTHASHGVNGKIVDYLACQDSELVGYRKKIKFAYVYIPVNYVLTSILIRISCMCSTSVKH